MSEESFPSNKKTKMTEESTDTAMRIDPTLHDFEKISKLPTFVDHSMLIQVFYEEDTALFIGAPRMFGKSTNMDMIKRFFDITENEGVKKNWKERAQYKLFKNLDIVTKGKEQHLEEHLGTHPVIFVDFGGCAASNLTEMFQFLCERLRTAFTMHERYLEDLFDKQKKQQKEKEEREKKTKVYEPLNHNKINNSDIYRYKKWLKSKRYADIRCIHDAFNSLSAMCEILYEAYGNRSVVILIDELDAIFTCAFENDFPAEDISILDDITEYIYLMIYKNIQNVVHAILITGVSFILGEYAWNEHFGRIACRFLDDSRNRCIDGREIVPFYGLNEHDLDKLLGKFRVLKNLGDNEVKTLKEKINKMFNGYYTRKGRQSIYPLYEVISYLYNGVISDPLMPSTLLAFKKAPMHHYIGRTIINLLEGNEQEIHFHSTRALLLNMLVSLRDDPYSDPNIYFKLLIDTGFLSHAGTPKLYPDGFSADIKKWKVRFSNDTVKRRFIRMLGQNNIQVGQFLIDHQDNCVKHLYELREYVSTEKGDIESILISLNKSLKNLFEGFRPLFPSECSENSLQVVLWMVMDRACSTNVFSDFTPTLFMTDKKGHNGCIDIWVVDEMHNIAMIIKVKYGFKKSTELTCSPYGLNEITNPACSQKKVCYADKFDEEREDERKKGVLMKGILMSVTIDEKCRPSISVAFRRNAAIGIEKPYYCVSATEKEKYEGFPRYKHFTFLPVQFN